MTQKSNRGLYAFLIKAAVLFFTWQVLYLSWLSTGTNLDTWLTYKTAASVSFSFNLIGYQSDYTEKTVQPGEQGVSRIIIDGEPSLIIADSCNALTLIVLFIGFIIAFEGHWPLKLVYILAGSLVIFGINVFRAMMLILIYMHAPSTFHFNHKYTFTILVYLAVFVFWMFWALKLSKLKLKRRPVRSVR
jgi:exosortase family protein XrtF